MPILVISSSVERIAKVRREAGAIDQPYHRTLFRAMRERSGPHPLAAPKPALGRP